MSAGHAVNIVSTGQLAKGFTADQVAKLLAQSFSIDEQQARQLMNAGRILKKSVNPEVAKQYQAALYKLGLKAAITEGKKAAVKALPRGPITGDEVRAAFDKDFSKPRHGLGRSAGLSGAAFGSLAGPAIYALVVAIVVYLLARIAGAMLGLGGDFNPSVFTMLLLPLLVVGLLLLLVLKPLIAPRLEPVELTLERARAPLFFDLVQVLCRRIGAPDPTLIRIHNEVDVTVSVTGGLQGLRKGKLQLSVGLPLIAALNTRQLAALLAHEFGHHTHITASQAYLLINAVNRLLHRATSGEDRWDQLLQQFADNDATPAALRRVAQGAQWLVLQSQRLFAALFNLNLRITADVSRQMDEHADYYSGQISGKSARKDAVLLRAIAYAYALVGDINGQALNQGKLLRDLAAATRWQLAQFDRKALLKIEDGMNRGGAYPWQFHPADNDRLELIEAEKFDADYELSFPAADSIGDFAELCADLTRDGYERQGIADAQALIVDNKQVLSTQEALGKAKAELADYFSGSFSDTRLMWLHAPSQAELNGQNTNYYVNWLRKNLMEYRKQQAAWNDRQDDLREMTLGRTYIAAGVLIEPSDFQLPKTGREDTDRAFAKVRGDIDTAMHKLQQVDQIFYCRMNAAINTMPGKEQIRSRRLLESLQAVADLRDKLLALQDHRYLLEALLANDEPMRGQIEQQLHKLTKESAQIVTAICNIAAKIPDRINKGEGTLNDYLLQWAGLKSDEVKGLTSAQLSKFADHIEQALLYQYQWVAGELVALCSKEEQRQNIQGLKLAAIKSTAR